MVPACVTPPPRSIVQKELVPTPPLRTQLGPASPKHALPMRVSNPSPATMREQARTFISPAVPEESDVPEMVHGLGWGRVEGDTTMQGGTARMPVSFLLGD